MTMLVYSSVSSAGNLYETNSRKYGVDPYLIQAIAYVESAGRPWTINIDGEAFGFNNRNDVIKYLRHVESRPWMVSVTLNGKTTYRWFATEQKAQEQYHSYVASLGTTSRIRARKVNPNNTDIGLMQVNWRYHGNQVGVTQEELLDPSVNMDYATRLLAGLIRQHGVWPGIARYHSSKSLNQKIYQQKIWTAYQRLKAHSRVDIASN
jgi:hypothetical protein